MDQLFGEEDRLSASLISLAEYLFEIDPFRPSANELPDNWREILSQWVKGVEIDKIGANYMPIIENVFSYRLVWAFEAVRVRRVSNGWRPEYTSGGASAAIENGLPLLMMSMIVRAGLPSRKAAIIAIRDSMASFNDSVEMQQWLKSDIIDQLTQKSNWPTTATSEIWKEFRKNALNRSHPTWHISYFKNLEFDNTSGIVPPPGIYRVEINSKGEYWLFGPDFKRLIMFKKKIKQAHSGIINATIIKDEQYPVVKRYGPGKVSWI